MLTASGGASSSQRGEQSQRADRWVLHKAPPSPHLRRPPVVQPDIWFSRHGSQALPESPKWAWPVHGFFEKEAY